MRILDLAIKDLSQIFRDKKSFLFLMGMPILFTFFMGFAYKNTDEQNPDNRLPLALVDPEPASPFNLLLTERLASSDSIKIIAMAESDAMDALSEGEVSGVLKIPFGFSEQVSAGSDPQLTLVGDSFSAEGQSLYQLLRVPISQLMSAVEISRQTADVVGESEQDAAFDLAWRKWTEVSKKTLVEIEEAVAEESLDWTGGNPYNQSSPGILVQFAIFGLVTSAQILVQEKRSRTLQRLITTAMKPWEIAAGHMLAMFTITFLQILILAIFGQLVLKVDYMREPLGILLILIMLGFWVASMGLLIGVVSKEENQVIMYSMIAMFLFSGLGGTWFPLETSSGAFAALGKLMPSAWAMTGLQNVLIRGLGLESVWKAVGILLVYALGFFMLAIWRFREMEGR